LAVGRIALAVAGVAALLPLTGLASATPSPSLSGILAPPPSADYAESDPTVAGVFDGPFDAKSFVSKTGSSKAAEIQATLERDGFVDGYARTWTAKSSQHFLLEYVMAFGGSDGAKRWLRSAEVADKADPNYQHALTLTGIDTYYGEHIFYASSKAYGDGFAFVKGNDFFTVIFASAADNLGTAAGDQAKVQFDSAPAYTIPPAQQTAPQPLAFDAGTLSADVVVFVFIVGLILLVVSRMRPSLRRRAIPSSALQLSPDGRYWWDGQAWKDSQLEIPATAQRSADGQLWWDGRAWRQVPPPS
jgi:hypothetical protein